MWSNKKFLVEHLKQPYIESLDAKIEALSSKAVEIEEYSKLMLSWQP
jgi:quinol monooxygenase YgiN